MNVQINNFFHYSKVSGQKPGRALTKPPRPPLPAALRTINSPQRPRVTTPLSCPTPQITYNYGPATDNININLNNNNNNNNLNNVENEQQWTCGACTFQNHPLLNRCEQCEVPRNNPSPGTVQSSSFSSPFGTNNSVCYENGGSSYSSTPTTPFSPALYPKNYAPTFPYTKPQ